MSVVDALSAWKGIIFSLQYHINKIKKSLCLTEAGKMDKVYKHFVE